jgi:hypothetical protein
MGFRKKIRKFRRGKRTTVSIDGKLAGSLPSDASRQQSDNPAAAGGNPFPSDLEVEGLDAMAKDESARLADYEASLESDAAFKSYDLPDLDQETTSPSEDSVLLPVDEDAITGLPHDELTSDYVKLIHEMNEEEGPRLPGKPSPDVSSPQMLPVTDTDSVSIDKGGKLKVVGEGEDPSLSDVHIDKRSILSVERGVGAGYVKQVDLRHGAKVDLPASSDLDNVATLQNVTVSNSTVKGSSHIRAEDSGDAGSSRIKVEDASRVESSSIVSVRDGTEIPRGITVTYASKVVGASVRGDNIVINDAYVAGNVEGNNIRIGGEPDRYDGGTSVPKEATVGSGASIQIEGDVVVVKSPSHPTGYVTVYRAQGKNGSYYTSNISKNALQKEKDLVGMIEESGYERDDERRRKLERERW